MSNHLPWYNDSIEPMNPPMNGIKLCFKHEHCDETRSKMLYIPKASQYQKEWVILVLHCLTSKQYAQSFSAAFYAACQSCSSLVLYEANMGIDAQKM